MYRKMYRCYNMFRNSKQICIMFSHVNLLSHKVSPRPCELGRVWIIRTCYSREIRGSVVMSTLVNKGTESLLHALHFIRALSLMPQDLGIVEPWGRSERVSQTEASNFNSSYAWVNLYNWLCWRPRVLFHVILGIPFFHTFWNSGNLFFFFKIEEFPLGQMKSGTKSQHITLKLNGWNWSKCENLPVPPLPALQIGLETPLKAWGKRMKPLGQRGFILSLSFTP